MFIDSSYSTGYCIWMPGTSKRPLCDNFSVIWATSYAMSSSEPPLPEEPPDASMVSKVSNIFMASVNAHLRGTDAVATLPLQTRRLSYGRVDGVTAVSHRVDAVDATSS